MVQYIIESQIVFTLLLLFYRIVLHNRVCFAQNRWVLYITIPLCFLIPLLEIPIYTPNVIPVILSDSQSISPDVLNSTKDIPIQLFAILYLCVSLIFLSVFLFSVTRIFLLMRRSDNVAQNGYSIFFIDNGSYGFSFFKNIFINGSRLKTDDLDMIIRHEMIHIKKNHSIDLIIGEILKILFWWNPAVWYWQKLLREVHEFQVDEFMLKESTSKKHYISLMIEQITDKYPEFVCGFSISSKNNSLTKKRLIMITKQNMRGFSKYRILLSIPILVALVAIFGFTTKTSLIHTDTITGDIMTVKDSLKIKSSTKTINLGDDKETKLMIFEVASVDTGMVFYIDSKKVSKEDVKKINPDNIKSMSVDKKANTVNIVLKNTVNLDEGTKIRVKGTSVDTGMVFYIDSKKASEEDVRKINPDNIKSMSVDKKANTVQVILK